MSKNCVKVSLAKTLKEARDCMDDNQQTCVLVVDEEGLLEGILTFGDIRRYLSKKSSDIAESDSRHSDVCNMKLFLLFVVPSCH
jgi:CBS domain-containing protein